MKVPWRNPGGQKNSITSSLRHLRSCASVMPAAPGHAVKFKRPGRGSGLLWLGLCLPLCLRRRRGKIVSGIKCKTKPSWTRKGYEQVEGHVSSRASQQAVPGRAVGEQQQQQQPRSSGVCHHKQGKLWALSFGAGTCHTVLQVIALGCHALSHCKPWAR